MDKRITFIKNYILFNLQGDLETEVLATKIGMSPGHFRKFLKTQTGESPAQFVKNIRLNKLKELLESNDGKFDKASQLYLRVGCINQRNLTTDFRKKFGMTPCEFQRQIWQKLSNDIRK